MNKIRFLFLSLICLSAPSFAQTEQAYTPPPMFGSPVVTPQPVLQQPAPAPIPQRPVQPPYVAQQQATAPTQLQPETTTPTPAVIAPAPVPAPQKISPQPKPAPTKSASAEELLSHPVTATPSPNTIDPLMASEIAKSKMPKPKDGEIVDDTGVDPSKVRYPHQNQKTVTAIKPAKPIIEDTSKKTEKSKSKSKGITTEQQKMPVVTTKNVEELSLAPMPNVKIANAKEKSSTPVPASTTSSSSKQTLTFAAGAGDITVAHKSSLENIVAGLKEKPSSRAQILSYATPTNATGSMSARRISLIRGLAIRTYLLSQGIDGGRVDVRALGDETGGKGSLDRADIIIME